MNKNIIKLDVKTKVIRAHFVKRMKFVELFHRMTEEIFTLAIFKFLNALESFIKTCRNCCNYTNNFIYSMLSLCQLNNCKNNKE